MNIRYRRVFLLDTMLACRPKFHPGASNADPLFLALAGLACVLRRLATPFYSISQQSFNAYVNVCKEGLGKQYPIDGSLALGSPHSVSEDEAEVGLPTLSVFSSEDSGIMVEVSV